MQMPQSFINSSVKSKAAQKKENTMASTTKVQRWGIQQPHDPILNVAKTKEKWKKAETSKEIGSIGRNEKGVKRTLSLMPCAEDLEKSYRFDDRSGRENGAVAIVCLPVCRSFISHPCPLAKTSR